MAVALWFFLWLLGPQTVTSSVQGIVVREGTTQPLSGEMVGLWPTTRTVTTGIDGRFSFGGVPAGQYVLTVVHDRIKLRVPITLTGGAQSESVTLEVKPAPAITGTVFDTNGERVAAARVQLRHSPYAWSARMRAVIHTDG
jgi:hypothetical protein